MRHCVIEFGISLAFAVLLCGVHGNLRLRKIERSIDNNDHDIEKLRNDLWFVEVRIDEMIGNITRLKEKESGNSKTSSDTGSSDGQPVGNHEEGNKDIGCIPDEVMMKINMALKSMSKEKLYIRTMVKGLEKLVRDGSIGNGVEERIRGIEDKLKNNVIQNAGVIYEEFEEDAKDKGDVKYSFFARLDKSRDIIPDPRAKQLGHQMHSKRLQFADVIHNDGDVYNPVTGMFTCKKDGVYLFVFFVEGIFRQKYSLSGQTTMVALSVDGKYQTLAASKAFNAEGRNTGGNSAILRLVRGQQVWLETVAPISQMITLREWVSTFSGTLLY